MSDSDLFNPEYLKRLGDGDAETEQHFCLFFGKRLATKLRRRIRSRQLIEDIRQETLLRVLASVKTGEVQHPERLGGFVNSVCNNVLRELVRSEERHPSSVFASADPRAPEDIEAELIGREQKEIVAAALDELSPRDREVLRLVCLEGVDREEVCKRMGIDSSYLRVLLHRAMVRARELVARRSSKDIHEV